MKLFLPFFLFLLPLGLYAQDPCEICSKSFEHDVKDTFQSETRAAFEQTMYDMYMKDFEFWENYSNSSQRSDEFEAAYKIYSANYKSDRSTESRREIYNKERTEYLSYRKTSQSQYEKIAKSMINRVPYDTFIACIGLRCGLGLSLTKQVAGKNLFITVRWNINGGPTNIESILSSISLSSNVKPLDFNFVQNRTKIKPLESITGLFEVTDDGEDVVVILNFSSQPALTATVESKSGKGGPPIGSIVISNLDFTTFCKANGISTTNLDYRKIPWVPADGRSVRNSKYADHAPSSKVPDLRGVFLRGKNQFYSEEEPNLDPSQADPNPLLRNSSGIQMDAIRSHSHKIKDDGHNHPLLTSSGARQPTGEVGSGIQFIGPFNFWQTGSLSRTSVTGIQVLENNDSGVETRPTNLAVYYYIRIN